MDHPRGRPEICQNDFRRRRRLGVAVLAPDYWLVDVTGRRYAPPTEYPHFFYGCFAVAMAWQMALFLIGSNPIQFRPLMVQGMLETAGYVTTLFVLLA